MQHNFSIFLHNMKFVFGCLGQSGKVIVNKISSVTPLSQHAQMPVALEVYFYVAKVDVAVNYGIILATS